MRPGSHGLPGAATAQIPAANAVSAVPSQHPPRIVYYQPVKLRRTAASFAGLVIACSAMVTLATPVSAQSSTLLVNGTTGRDQGNCTQTACLTLPYALSQAASGDTIEITGTVNTWNSATPNGAVIPSGITDITITGYNNASGFGVLTGGASSNGEVGHGSVLTVNDNQQVTLEHLELTDGTASKGGGLANTGNVILNHDLVVGNYAVAPTAQVAGSTATYVAEGAGIYNDGSMTIDNTAIVSNIIPALLFTGHSTVQDHLFGAGIYTDGALTVANSTISGNLLPPPPQPPRGISFSVVENGAGVFNNSLETTIVQSSITNNESYDGPGSGIYEGPGFLASPALSIGASIVAYNLSGPTVSGTFSDCAGAPDDTAISSLGYNLTDPTGGCQFAKSTDEVTGGYGLGLVDLGNGLYAHAELTTGSAGLGAIPFGTKLANGDLVCPGLDELGDSRPASGTGPCDVGAIETGSSPITPVAPAILGGFVGRFTVGSFASYQLLYQGTPLPAVFVTKGTLPKGITLSPTGVLSGTPAPGTAGSYTLTVSAENGVSPPASTQGSVIVKAAPSSPESQTIKFTSTAPSNARVGGASYTVAAIASSGLPVTFSSGSPSVCTVSGSTVAFVGAGTCVVDANQSGDSSYAPAPQASQSFAVAAAPKSPKPNVTTTPTSPSTASGSGSKTNGSSSISPLAPTPSPSPASKGATPPPPSVTASSHYRRSTTIAFLFNSYGTVAGIAALILLLLMGSVAWMRRRQ